MRTEISFVIIFGVVSLQAGAQNLRLKKVSFDGNEILSDDVLLDQMNTLPKKGVQKLFFWKKSPDFIPSTLESDAERLRSFYNRNGFLNPEISYSLDTVSGRKIKVHFKITENRFVRYGKTSYILKDDPVTSYLVDSLKKVIPVKQGERFTDAGVLGSVDQMNKAFSDYGFPFSRVNYKLNVIKDSLLANVTFDIDPGAKSFFGSTTIDGNIIVSDKFIRKYFLFSEGDPFSRKKIDRTQQDLFSTDLFQFVVLSPLKDSVVDNRIPVNVLLRELPRWRLETGIGYGSEDKLRLSAQVTRLNFLGGTRRIVFNAKTSYFLPFSFDLKFVQPWFLVPKLDLVLNPFYMREREISYRIDRVGGSVSFLYRLSRSLNANFSYAYESDRILQISDLQLDPSELKHNKSVFTIGGQINTSDDPFYPSRGYRINADVSYAGVGSRGNIHYYKLDLTFIRYILIEKDLVFALRLTSGVIQATQNSIRTPVEERFFLGGANSLRGWGRRRISPLNDAGVAIGGNTMAEASGELRFPIYDILSGVVFFEAGNAWAPTYRYDLASLNYDAGIGLRLKTPVGPLRLDFATPVISEKFNLQFFISVGHAF
jgi:outer membrane protein insertion porin family